MYIDTHCHLNFKVFENDWREVIKKAQEAGVKKIIIPGTDLKSSKRAVEMAEKVDGVYATVGYHPHHARGLEKIDEGIKEELLKLAGDKKVVGVGECGLDYHVYKNTKYEIKDDDEEWKKLKILQKQLLGMQIQLAKELDLPMVIHNREAEMDILDVIDHFCKSDGKYPEGVFHSVSGSEEYIKKVLKMGFYVGVDGNVTYDKEVEKLTKIVPLDRLLLETDSPYLTPEPIRSERRNRGERLRNEPIGVKITAEFIAKLKNTSFEKVGELTTRNAKILFDLS